MSKSMSVDYEVSFRQGGRGAKKNLVEGPKQAEQPKEVTIPIPRISRYMALAIHFEDLIRRGVVTDYADLARLGHVTRARVTQIMNLRLLAPEIQEELLFLEPTTNLGQSIQLRWLQTLAKNWSWQVQRKHWKTRGSQTAPNESPVRQRRLLG